MLPTGAPVYPIPLLELREDQTKEEGKRENHTKADPTGAV